MYDARNAPNETTYKTEYRYDAVGNMVLQIDAAGNETAFEYDVLGRQTASIREGDRRTESHYDTFGRLASAVNARGQVIQFDYDPMNDRLLSKDLPPGQADVAYTYFDDGLTHTVADDRGTTSYEYNDPRGRLTKRIDPDGATIEYAYDLVGNISSVKTTTPGNSPHLVTYEYDAQNRLIAVHDGVDDTVYTYDPSSRLLEIEYPNGVIEAREYDNVGRLTGVVHTIGSTTLAAYGYDFDLAGNITEVWENTGRVTEYVYDELYRLISERATDSALGDLDVDYDYDDVGNRLQKVDHTASATTEYHYNSSNELEYEVTGATRIDYDYDADGNTISKTTQLSGVVIDEVLYRWSSGNRLVGLDANADGTDDVTYQYDDSGIRVSQTDVATGEEIHYLIDRERPFAQVLDEYQPTGANTTTTIVSYTYGNGLISQTRIGGTNYYHSDAHSGVRLLTDATGAATDHYTFDAFGALLHSAGSTSNAYLYRAEQFDSNLDQYYNRARYYDPSSGRFTALDPQQPGVGDLANANLYLYASANPISYFDPSGLESLGSVSVSVSVSISLQGMSGRAITGALSGAVTGYASAAVDSYLGGNPDWQEKAQQAALWGAIIGGVTGGFSPQLGRMWKALPHWFQRALKATATTFVGGSTALGVNESLEEGNWAQGGVRLTAGLLALYGLSNLKVCFASGTFVATECGQKEIQDIRRDDRVWSFDLLSGRWCLSRVLDIHQLDYHGQMIDLELSGTRVVSTSRHPFWVADGNHLDARAPSSQRTGVAESPFYPKGRWIDAGDLKAGDQLLSLDGALIQVTAVRQFDASEKVYNLSVADFHSYAVGHASVLVHNDCGDIQNVYNSLREALGERIASFRPRLNGIWKEKISNSELLSKLRDIEAGKWQKVYKDGTIDGKRVSIHYFESPSGKVFDAEVHNQWSNK